MNRTFWAAMITILVGLTIAGCGGTVSTTSTSSLTPAASPTSTATAVVSPAGTTQAPCQDTVNGSQVTVSESAILLNITYSAVVHEADCALMGYSNGQELFQLGNLMDVYAEPAAGRTIQQYVDAKKMPYETITLSPVTVRQAQEAYLVQVQLASNAPGPGYFNGIGAVALLRGSHYIYEVRQLQAKNYPGPTDDTPSDPLSNYVPGFAVG